MEKLEIIKKKQSSICINVTNGNANSLRIKNDEWTSVRVYDGIFIGVAGKEGKADVEDLKNKAKTNLKRGVPYVNTQEKPVYKSINTKKDIICKDKFLDKVKEVISKITEQNPNFIISGKEYLFEKSSSYENSFGSNLSYDGNSLEYSILFKHKNSANIFDGGFSSEGNYDFSEEFIKDVKTVCDTFNKNLPTIEDDEVTVLLETSYFTYALRHFLADVYCNNASLFNGKLGEKIFSEKLSAVIDRRPTKQLNLEYFDTEGVINEDYLGYIIKDGVFRNVLTTKNTASQYSVENLGSAEAGHSDVPQASAIGFNLLPSNDSAKDLLKNEKAIFVVMASGGDMTPDGTLSLPVQVAYLYENGEFKGKLPEFTLTANFSDIFGENLLGVCKNDLFLSPQPNLIVSKMRVVNKQ